MRLYADAGLSGTKIKIRKEFQQLLRDAELGQFEAVVVKDISRFARNTVDLLQSIRKLKSLGIETIFLTANMRVLGQSEFVLTIFGALAQEESANISKRVKFGKMENAKKGRVPNLVYGYNKLCGDCFTLEINEEEAATIRQIFLWYTQEGYGSARIAKMLNGQGVLTKQGCSWSQTAVCRILTNRLYTGIVINGKEEVTDFLTSARRKLDETSWYICERPELRIIPQGMFDLAQRIIRERGTIKKGGSRHSGRHLFSNLIRCGECGGMFRRTVRTYNNTYIRWSCGGRSDKGADYCKNSAKIDENALVNALKHYFISVLPAKKDILKSFAADVRAQYGQETQQRDDERLLENRRRKLIASRERYIKLYAEGVITLGEVNAKVASIDSELRAAEEMLAAHKRNKALIRPERNSGFEISCVEDIAMVHDMCNADMRRILRFIVVDMDGGADIYIKDPSEN